MRMKIWGMILALGLCLAFVPSKALAAADYNVWVNGECFTDEKLVITCGSGTATYDPATNQLTLNNATITKAAATAGLSSPGAISFANTGDITIVVKGTNTITLADGAYRIHSGEEDKLTLSGDGSLEITTGGYDCICCKNAMTVNMDGDMTLNSDGNGLWVLGDLSISGSGNITAVCGARGFYSITNIDISGSGVISIQSDSDALSAWGGGNANIAISGESDIFIDSQGYGIYANGDLSISGSGDVKVESTGPVFETMNGALTISGSGDVSLKSRNEFCVLVSSGIDISGSGDVTIQSHSDFACCVYSGAFTISGSGDVTVDSENSIGVYILNGNLILSGNGSKVSVSGGEMAVCLEGTDSHVLLNGSAIQISFEATDCVIAIESGTSDSPVAGDNLSDYAVTGAPNTNSVVYKLKKLTFKFDMGGHGEAIDDQRVSDGSAAEQPADPTADGFIFDGWYADAAFTEMYDFAAAVTTHTTVYAKWLTAYTVSFDMGGHGSAPENQTVISGDKARQPEDPTADGFVFDGWYTDEDLTTEYDFDAPVTANVTIYAKWEALPVVYKIIEGQEAEWTQGTENGLLISSDAPFDKFDCVTIDGKDLAAENYTAAAGSTKITLKPGYLDTIDPGRHTIVIVSADGSASTNFTIKIIVKYTVNFNMNGKGEQIAAQMVAAGNKAVQPTAPAVDKYTFGGWYTDAALTTAFDFGTAVNTDLTLYAKWIEDSGNSMPPSPDGPDGPDSPDGPEGPDDPDNPNTGDDSAPVLWVILCAISIHAIVILNLRRRKTTHVN